MKKLLILFILLFVLVGCDKDRATYISVSTSKAIEMMETETDYVILDVRTEVEYQSGHIKGAINYPNENIKEEMLDILSDKDQLFFVYCRSGNRSKQASQKMADIGYTNIVEIGGINFWPFDLEY